MLTAIIIYLVGYFLSYKMLSIDHESENKPVTHGSRTLAYILSFLSFLMVIIILVSAWIKNINASGYWNKPIKPIPTKKADNK